jgi:hypothetical protein
MMDIPQNKQLLALLDQLNGEWEAKPEAERVAK